MTHVDAGTFLELARTVPVVDVRSPKEFEEGHISSAVNIALFSDDERALIGTMYKNLGRDQAVSKGLEVVGPKMAALAQAAKDVAVDGRLLVHCWRGGMRSNSMAWLFEQAGLQCSLLSGGYKAYRNHMLSTFSDMKGLVVLEGATGSGKTEILQHLSAMGRQVIDLEALASHRGSAFGSFGMGPQPTSQQFQNDLFSQWSALDRSVPVWVEGESLTIGRVYLPHPFWQAMNRARIIEVDMPRELRAQRLVTDYGALPNELLAEGIRRITDQFGGNRVKEALALLHAGDLYNVALLLLAYYDERYLYGREKHGRKPSVTVPLTTIDPQSNARSILAAI
jgi:tRNA 2-selenouridine synthase